MVNFEEIATQSGMKLGVATLARSKALNSLTLEMIEQLRDKFGQWMSDHTSDEAPDEEMALLVLQSESDRAFCAGADIQALYRSIIEVEGGDNPYAQAFFTHEYELDFNIHGSARPILVWGHNIVMGGGLGLLGGCSHRVGTPETRVAMPEITIGLFPDAGGSWYLSRMKDHLGYFVGLTGCQLPSGDAFDLGIINHVIEHDRKEEVMAHLGELPWTGDALKNRKCLTSYLVDKSVQVDELPRQLAKVAGPVSELIRKSLAADAFFPAFDEALGELLDQLPDNEWLQQAAANYRRGSPTTARVFIEQMRRAKQLDLAGMFRMELVIAYRCLRQPDFPEGVRALLIDKDKSPRWACASAAEVPDAVIAKHFEPVWQGQGPLAHLGRQV